MDKLVIGHIERTGKLPYMPKIIFEYKHLMKYYFSISFPFKKILPNHSKSQLIYIEILVFHNQIQYLQYNEQTIISYGSTTFYFISKNDRSHRTKNQMHIYVLSNEWSSTSLRPQAQSEYRLSLMT